MKIKGSKNGIEESREKTAALKAALRRQMKQQRAELSDGERRHAGESCAAQLRQLPEFVRCDLLLAYMSHGAELPTAGMIEEALEKGMRVAVPRVTGPGTMEFYEIYSLSECVPGAYGIPEPAGVGERLVHPEEFESAAALLPGLAFTKDGARLGYGGGYYDRYFSEHRKAYRIGLTYGFALVEHLPCEPHDIRADVVLAPVSP